MNEQRGSCSECNSDNYSGSNSENNSECNSGSESECKWESNSECNSDYQMFSNKVSKLNKNPKYFIGEICELLRRFIRKGDKFLCEAIDTLCVCDLNNRNSELHQQHLVIFNKTVQVFFAVHLTLFDNCILEHHYLSANALLQKGAPLRKDTLWLTFINAHVWNLSEIAQKLFEFAESSDLEAFVLHSVADFDETAESIEPIDVPTRMKILNLFCNCEDFNASEHVKHLRILNGKYTGNHIHWYPELYEYYVEDDNGFTLLEKYMIQGVPDIVHQLVTIGATLQTDSLHKLIKSCNLDGDQFNSILDLFPRVREELYTSVDKSDLTIFQLAAKHNRIAVLKYILTSRKPVGYQTAEGENGLLLAVQNDSKEAVEFLVQNGAELGCLDYSKYRDDENEWDVFVEAVKSNKTEIALLLFNEYPYSFRGALKHIQKYAPNNDLMKIVVPKYVESERKRGKTWYVSELFSDLLRHYIRKCDFELFETLLQAFPIQLQPGVLHELIRMSCKNPEFINQIKNAYQLIVKYSCDENVEKSKTIFDYISVKMKNYEDKNVLEYACSIIAVDMIEEMLNTERVFYFKHFMEELSSSESELTGRMEPEPTETSLLNSESIFVSKYDVSNLMPNTITDCEKINDKTEPENNKSEISTESPNTRQSLVEILIESSENEESELAIAKLLDKEPFRSLTESLFIAYRRFSFWLLFFHMLYMSLFTWCLSVTNNMDDVNNDTMIPNIVKDNSTTEILPEFNLDTISQQAKGVCFLVFTAWPIFLFHLNLFEIYFSLPKLNIKRRIAWCRSHCLFSKKRCSLKNFKNLPFVFIEAISSAWLTFINFFSSVFTLAFTGIALVWIILNSNRECYNDLYVKLVAFFLIMGWMNTLNYISVLAQPIADLIVMVKRIFAKDFFTFIIVYIFFYIGLAFAFTSIQFSQRTHPPFNSDELFVKILSIDNVINVFENDQRTDIVMVIISVYCFISFLVLSNLLIAMVNQSYSDINELSIQQKQYFRLQLLRKSFWWSRLTSKLFRGCRNSSRNAVHHQLSTAIYKDPNDNKYYMILTSEQVLRKNESGNDFENLYRKVNDTVLRFEDLNRESKSMNSVFSDKITETNEQIKEIKGNIGEIMKILESNHKLMVTKPDSIETNSDEQRGILSDKPENLIDENKKWQQAKKRMQMVQALKNYRVPNV